MSLLRDTLAEWREDRVPRLGAALAFYTFFSAAPLLVIAVAIGSRVYSVYSDGQSLDSKVQTQLSEYIGREPADAVEQMMQSAQQSRLGSRATLISVAALLVAATGALVALKDALNTIWGVMPRPGAGWWALAYDRIQALVIVLVVGFLLLVSATLTTVVTVLASFAAERLPFSLPAVEFANWTISLGVVATLFAAVFKLLPDVEVGWGYVWPGALGSAALFLIGSKLFGLYVRHSALTSSYGAAGSLAVLLLFTYYSAQILFLGAEFTQVYARENGCPIEPKRGSMRMSELLHEARVAEDKLARQDRARQRLSGRKPSS